MKVMKKIVECVPNFSEGRNQDTIEAIAEAIAGTPGCKLIDVDPGKSTNRTVYTFVGDPASVVEGALSAAREAKRRIDMRSHKGEHPRFGAMDVCPFVPVAGTTMEACVKIAEECGQRLANELDVPVYLYEQAARQDYRRKLPDVRQGEYEGLEKKPKDPDWKPDFGPSNSCLPGGRPPSARACFSSRTMSTSWARPTRPIGLPLICAKQGAAKTNPAFCPT